MREPGEDDLLIIGRYALDAPIAAGGMATVHIGRLLSDVGFARTVAIKRLLPHVAEEDEFTEMFLDEARLAARIRHPNVVPTLDVVYENGELLLVMEYVPGVSLATLSRAALEAQSPLPIPAVVSVIVGALHGLQAAHEATNEDGKPLGLVHRDVSPQNILVGTDGVSRLLDFGIAKAEGRLHTTREGQLKGKLAYMAPEQLRGDGMSPLVDVYAAGICLWESLTGRRLYVGKTERETIQKVLAAEVEPPSRLLPRGAAGTVQMMNITVLQRLDAVVLRALAAKPKDRFASAREFAVALEACMAPANQQQVGDLVLRFAADILRSRSERIGLLERRTLSITTSGAAARPLRGRSSFTDNEATEMIPQPPPHTDNRSPAQAARDFDSDHPTLLDRPEDRPEFPKPAPVPGTFASQHPPPVAPRESRAPLSLPSESRRPLPSPRTPAEASRPASGPTREGFRTMAPVSFPRGATPQPPTAAGSNPAPFSSNPPWSASGERPSVSAPRPADSARSQPPSGEWGQARSGDWGPASPADGYQGRPVASPAPSGPAWLPAPAPVASAPVVSAPVAPTGFARPFVKWALICALVVLLFVIIGLVIFIARHVLGT